PLRSRARDVPAHPSRRSRVHRRGRRDHVHDASGRALEGRTRPGDRAVFVDLCADIVGPDVNIYWDQAVYKKPEKPRRFPWHQDTGHPFTEPQQCPPCWIAPPDPTEQNGCPWIAPGAHRAGTLAHTYVEPLGYECFDEPPTAARPAPVRAGSALVFSSL